MISEEVLIVWEYELMDRGVLSYGLGEKSPILSTTNDTLIHVQALIEVNNC